MSELNELRKQREALEEELDQIRKQERVLELAEEAIASVNDSVYISKNPFNHYEVNIRIKAPKEMDCMRSSLATVIFANNRRQVEKNLWLLIQELVELSNKFSDQIEKETKNGTDFKPVFDSDSIL